MSLLLDTNHIAQTNPGLTRLDPAYALAAHLAERHLLGYLMLNGGVWRVACGVWRQKLSIQLISMGIRIAGFTWLWRRWPVSTKPSTS